ncbi:MAG TPA: hypothetical protein VMU83_22145 [Hanamia sp.]|nr:hypothetical protein [Hanamia sp.]
MIRTVITPTNTNIRLSIPKEYVGKPIEVTCLPLEELEQNSSKKTMRDFWGVISDETAKILYEQVDQNRKEW